ncbi:MAG: hypothetical protein ACRDP7_33370 [Trebonia sp.]
MSDEPAQPDNELSQLIRKAIEAGATAGAEAAARQITAAVGVELGRIKEVLQALGTGNPAQPVTVSGSVSLSSMAVAGDVQVTMPKPAVAGAGTLGGVSPTAGAALAGAGTLGVSRAEVAAAAGELSTASRPTWRSWPDGRPPGGASRNSSSTASSSW